MTIQFVPQRKHICYKDQPVNVVKCENYRKTQVHAL
jgi:hypothetical protein